MKKEICSKCKGSGYIYAGWICDKCLGIGKVNWIEQITGKKSTDLYKEYRNRIYINNQKSER